MNGITDRESIYPFFNVKEITFVEHIVSVDKISGIVRARTAAKMSSVDALRFTERKYL